MGMARRAIGITAIIAITANASRFAPGASSASKAFVGAEVAPHASGQVAQFYLADTHAF